MIIEQNKEGTNFMEKNIIIMAKSFKHGGYCIAGIDTESNHWIRLMSDDTEKEGAVPEEDAKYVNVLDVVCADISDEVATEAQKENFRYNKETKWEKVGSITIGDVIKKYGFDDCDYLFGNTNSSLAENELDGSSLLFLEIQKPTIVVSESLKTKKKKLSLEFKYNEQEYKGFSLSDIPFYKKFKEFEFGEYKLAESCYATLSLTGRYKEDGRYYKMAAQIFCPDLNKTYDNGKEIKTDANGMII